MRWYLSRYRWALIRYLMEIIWSDSQILPCSRHHAGAWSRGAGGTHFNTKRSLLAENSYSTGRGAITQMKIRSDWEGCGCRIMNQLQWEHRGEKIPSVLGSPRGLQGKAHIGVLLSFWGCGLDKWEGSRCSAAQSCPTLQPHGLQPAGSFVHGISQARIIGTGCHFLLQGIFLTQGSNLHLLCLLYCQADSLPSKKPEGQLIWGARKSLSKGLGVKGLWNGVLSGLVLLARAGADEALHSWPPTAFLGPHMKRCLWPMGAGGGSLGGEGCGPEWKTSREREDEQRKEVWS